MGCCARPNRTKHRLLLVRSPIRLTHRLGPSYTKTNRSGEAHRPTWPKCKWTSCATHPRDDTEPQPPSLHRSHDIGRPDVNGHYGAGPSSGPHMSQSSSGEGIQVCLILRARPRRESNGCTVPSLPSPTRPGARTRPRRPCPTPVARSTRATSSRTAAAPRCSARTSSPCRSTRPRTRRRPPSSSNSPRNSMTRARASRTRPRPARSASRRTRPGRRARASGGSTSRSGAGSTVLSATRQTWVLMAGRSTGRTVRRTRCSTGCWTTTRTGICSDRR